MAPVEDTHAHVRKMASVRSQRQSVRLRPLYLKLQEVPPSAESLCYRRRSPQSLHNSQMDTL